MKKHLLFLFTLIISFSITSAQDTFEPGELLVQLKPGADISTIEKAHEDIELYAKQLLSRRMNIWLFTYNENKISVEDILFSIRQTKDVKIVQFNYHVKHRSAGVTFSKNGAGHETMFEMMPNDVRFNEQWALHNTGQSGGLVDADIDAPEAWDITTGGLTVAGDSIVIAVIDSGFDLNHPDLYFWKNYAEIPGNGIDDDGNGYVDDYHGWNAYNNNGTITSSQHGTHVSGIAAARGNNNIGVSGVNWNAKVMPIQGSSSNQATVVIAYDYVLNMRAKYNETNGAQGAFVVSTNASFGVDYGQPSNYPLWCAIYDSLGVQGVISCGATANANINIDVTGDIPTACPSNYLVSVTNTTRTDTKNSGAAYGLTTIDLGAPGTAILNTVPNNSYSNLTGTSMATPTVAGAVGLMFAAANADVLAIYKSNYSAGAQMFIQHLLSTTDSIPALAGITVTGGRLNVHKAALAVNQTIPVELRSFAYEVHRNDVLLNWITATEINNSGFSVERKDNQNGWTEIAFIHGKGNSTEFNNYSYNDANVAPGSYNYRLKQIDHDGSFSFSNVIEVLVDNPADFALLQNYPNPFNPSTKIGYRVPAAGNAAGYLITLKVYDILGNEVATLVNEQKPAGTYEVEFQSSSYNLASGVYFYRLAAEEINFSRINRMVVLK